MIQLSIIIPYYNVSAYIERCARSLMEQTQNTGLEFIFINDDSCDDSEQILQRVLSEYPKRQDQIKMINLQCHEGVSIARKRGMEEAAGDYLIHCDADDWVDPTAYQSFFDKISETKADVIICPFIHEYSGHQYVETYRELPPAACLGDQRWWSLCTHAVRRSLIEQYHLYPMADISFWEDLDLLMRVTVHAQTFAYLPVPLYHYDRTHIQSVVHQNKGITGFIQCQRVIDHLTPYLQTYAPQQLHALNLLKRAARDLYLEGEHPDYKAWSRSYPETWTLIWKNHHLSLAYRLCYLLGSCHVTWPMRTLLSIVRKPC